MWGVALAQTGFGLPYDASGGLITRPDGEPLSINPLRVQQFDIGQATRNRVFGSAFSDFHLAEGLTWRVNFGPDITLTNGTVPGPEVTPPTTTFSRGSMRQQETFAYTLDNILQFNRTLGHIASTSPRSIASSHSGRRPIRCPPGTCLQRLALVRAADGTVEGQLSTLDEWAVESVMGRLNYTFLDKYTVSAAIRRDGGSLSRRGAPVGDLPIGRTGLATG